MTDDAQAGSSSESSPTYVDTPYGLVTAAGRWYHIPEADVRAYAEEVLEHVSLDQLVQWADVWIDSPRTVTLWGVPPLLWGLSGAGAALGALLLYVGWALASPAFPSVGGARVASGLANVWGQGVYYAGTLSVFAANEHFGAVGIGLLAFVLLRWGIVEWVGRMLLRPVRRRLYPMPVTDQVLRGLIVRAALKYRVSVPQVDALTRNILENWGARTDASDESDPSASSPTDTSHSPSDS